MNICQGSRDLRYFKSSREVVAEVIGPLTTNPFAFARWVNWDKTAMMVSQGHCVE